VIFTIFVNVGGELFESDGNCLGYRLRQGIIGNTQTSTQHTQESQSFHRFFLLLKKVRQFPDAAQTSTTMAHKETQFSPKWGKRIMNNFSSSRKKSY
jgi:hypothetical protein